MAVVFLLARAALAARDVDSCPALPAEQMRAELTALRQRRNSGGGHDFQQLYEVTTELEQKMKIFYGVNDTEDQVAVPCVAKEVLPRPGNLHGIKSHAYYVGAIRSAHRNVFAESALQSIVASEWYHPGLTAKPVWCVENCALPLARRLDAHAAALSAELRRFWAHADLKDHLKGVGEHTTGFDRLIAGNGTWVDVRLWRGRAFHRELCRRHFRVTCSLIEASPEVWTNPWSHVLISVLLPGSWVPFHQGHTNGQLTYHFAALLPEDGAAELAVLEGSDAAEGGRRLTHPEETTVSWRLGRTLVFDDSFTHAVRYRGHASGGRPPRLLLLTRAWHPELGAAERRGLRELIRRGGEEQPEGYEMLPLPSHW
ncbi:unnamed protein product [Effrenium voratum]|uniref:Aspartyl/asparaginy/proline hydroxylase domain-containing protein n=1 Tax=Effrenium voratum TaxID=2562239 RepID=A0AA36JME1_9DINO|nr:unnamed protein product [Effrenium voratum]